MYTRLAALVPVAALAAVVAAAPNALQARDGGGSQCNNGEIQCCDSTEESTPTTLTILSALLGIVLPDIGGLIGLSCDPITVIGTGSGSTCTEQTVCCTDNDFNGLVNLGCTPINLGV